MFDIQEQNGYRVINLIDGTLLSDAVQLVESQRADGINLNFIRNFPDSIDQIKLSKRILFLAINDYDHKRVYDYSAVHYLQSLRHLSIYTTDKKEIDYSAFPILTSTAIMWRPKAKSLFEKGSLQRLFLGRYSAPDLSALSKLSMLEYLRINTGSVISLNGISELISLKELLLMQMTKLEDIQHLADLKALRKLRIDNCRRIKNIDSVRKLNIPNLELVGTTPN